MAGASIRAVCDFSALNEAASDEDVSSKISVPTDTGTRGVSGDSNMAADKGSGGKSTKEKEKSSSTTASLRKSAKLSDLDKLESTIVDQMTLKFEFEMNKKPFTKRKSTFQSDSSAPKKARNSEDSDNKPFRSGSNYCSNYKKPFRGAQSSGYRNNTSRSNSVSGFRPQGGKSNSS